MRRPSATTRATARAQRGLLALAGLGAALALPGAGCEEYRVSMSIRGERIERELALFDSGGEPAKFDAPTSARLAALYGQEVEGPTHRFHGVFRGSTPDDVGGTGSVAHAATALGSAGVYLERFRGETDLAGALAGAWARVDVFVELVDGWLAERMPAGPEAERLRRAVRERLGPDLSTLEVYSLAGRMDGSGEDRTRSLLMRLLQHAVERGYFALDQLPRLVRLAEGKDPAPLLARLAAGLLGVPPEEPVPEALAFLADGDGVAESFLAHAARSPRFRAWAEARGEVLDASPSEGAEGSREGSAEEPPEDRRRALVEKWLDEEVTFLQGVGALFFGASRLHVSIELPVRPFANDGEWNAESGRITWPEGPTAPPAFGYAAWAEPDAAAQTARLGAVVLRDAELFRYAFWHAGLDAPEAEEWSAFLAGLEPGEGLAARIRAFRFSDEALPKGPPGAEPEAAATAPDAKPEPSRAQEILELLAFAVSGPAPEAGAPAAEPQAQEP